MPNETTQGENRGAMRASKEPVVPPLHIERGGMTIPGRYSRQMFPDGARYTFSLTNGKHLLTYHDVEVISVRPDELRVFVGPHDLVTWDDV